MRERAQDPPCAPDVQSYPRWRVPEEDAGQSPAVQIQIMPGRARRSAVGDGGVDQPFTTSTPGKASMS